MEPLNKKSYGWLKKVIIIAVVLLIAGLGLVWYIFNEKFADTSGKDAAFSLSALQLIGEFEKNDSVANIRYAEKIIIIAGEVAEVEVADTTVNVKMINPATGSYIIFAFQQENQAEARKIKVTDKLAIKGSCSGGAYSNILEVESINFKRCVLNK